MGCCGDDDGKAGAAPSNQGCGCSNAGRYVNISGIEKKDKTSAAPDSESRRQGVLDQEFITGIVQTPAGPVPQTAARLAFTDVLGAIRVRWGIRRDHYRVDPGLYAIGTPDERSDVFVSANYKLSFDMLRKNLAGLNAWVLVLDTKGINVWCAAGKGTFGTEELVRRIRLTSLAEIVIHRRLILPQLGATGVAAHQIKQLTGFTVLYGPVRAVDIQPFIRASYKATKEMRQVKFGWYDRLKLVPNDIIYNMRYLVPLLAVLSIISGFSAGGYSFESAIGNLAPLAKTILIAYGTGIVLTPLLLPFVPVQSFYLKGLILGSLSAGVLYLNNSLGGSLYSNAAGFFFIAGFSSFLAMLFTGASTYTSLAGVKKEMKTAVPVQIACGIGAAAFSILSIY